MQTEPVRLLFHTAAFFPLAGVFHLSLGLHHYSGGISGRAELDEEILELEYELSAFRVFPHISFGMRFRIGD